MTHFAVTQGFFFFKPKEEVIGEIEVYKNSNDKGENRLVFKKFSFHTK